MAKRKTKRTSKKTNDWAEIGQMIGKKLEKESKCSAKFPWNKTWIVHSHEGKGFFGRLLFAVMLVWALNIIGVFTGVPAWIQILMIIGFAFMRL